MTLSYTNIHFNATETSRKAVTTTLSTRQTSTRQYRSNKCKNHDLFGSWSSNTKQRPSQTTLSYKQAPSQRTLSYKLGSCQVTSQPSYLFSSHLNHHNPFTISPFTPTPFIIPPQQSSINKIIFTTKRPPFLLPVHKLPRHQIVTINQVSTPTTQTGYSCYFLHYHPNLLVEVHACIPLIHSSRRLQICHALRSWSKHSKLLYCWPPNKDTKTL